MMQLPERPDDLRGSAVAVWHAPVEITTYPLLPADRNPMFLEKRVYQGSSGRVYPNPVVDRVSDEAVDRSWAAVHLENEYLRLMVLPEIGGRVHVALDRTNNYDFFYRHDVIKPALVGLLGPWISGGVEVNWPQHHRPSTFMPVDVAVEQLADGGQTVWCSEHEPMGRMKGMHGVTLRPGSSVIELRARIFNRTPYVQTFLWWANAGARVHERYQAFFPPDVTYVADHAKRAVSSFPVARGTYYGVDYGSRPPAAADLSWYRNIPVPTSYMVIGTKGEFFGGYDHAAEAGFVHWADHRISPGKKLWTWGSGPFGKAWDRELSDDGGPYVELMAGVYTDNQPDFSFLAPYETKTFSQYWYPISRIGPPQAATLDGALSFSSRAGRARVGLAVTRSQRGATVRLMAGNRVVMERTSDLAPGQSLVLDDIALPVREGSSELCVTAVAEGRELVRWRPVRARAGERAVPASEPPLPPSVETLEELYLIGQHLAQYRHATRRPEDYWEMALRRSPEDSRANIAMGWWHLRRGEGDVAAARFRAATVTLTRLNPNPYDSEAFYGLGLALRYKGHLEEADEALAKAGWAAAWRGPAAFARAQLASRRGDYEGALSLLEKVIDGDADHLAARGLRAAVQRRLGRTELAAKEVAAVLTADPLDVMALDQSRVLNGSVDPLPGGAQTAIDLALDYASAGLIDEAIATLRRELSEKSATRTAGPMLRYTLAWLLREAKSRGFAGELRRAAAMPPDYCFPSRIEEIVVLQAAMEAAPSDPRAPYYLGNLLYDKQRYDEAIAAWERAARLDPTFATVHRNLGIAEFNVRRRPDRALASYRKALRSDANDARVLYEFDQLSRRCGLAPAGRARFLRSHIKLVDSRDDLTVELVTLLNVLGEHQEALAVLMSRRFHPWEGGEGLVSAQWVLTNLRLAQLALEAREPEHAVLRLEAALERPDNLGEGKHLLTAENEVHYHLALAHLGAGRDAEARRWMGKASTRQGGTGAPLGEPDYWRAMAFRALGEEGRAVALLQELLRAARERSREPQEIDYFATSLPTFLVFDDDLGERNRVNCLYLKSLALAGLGRRREAVQGLREVAKLDTCHTSASRHVAMLEAKQKLT